MSVSGTFSLNTWVFQMKKSKVRKVCVHMKTDSSFVSQQAQRALKHPRNAAIEMSATEHSVTFTVYLSVSPFHQLSQPDLH